MSTVKKIAVVGDGPIGNIVIANLLIEHHKNNIENKNIEITHYTSERVRQKGYTRRHILFITDKLVDVLETNVLNCKKCLYNAANNQKLHEDYANREKLLFSTRVLENILFNQNKTNKDTYCSDPKCTFTFSINNDKDIPDYYKYDYVFFAIGSNSTAVRKKYLYNDIDNNTIKIIANETEPIVAFYSNLGNVNSSSVMFDEDKKSLITLVNKQKLLQADINIYELDIFANIIYAFHDKFYAFIETLDKTQKDTILANQRIKDLYKKQNLSLDGYLNFNDYLYKFTLAINNMQYLFINKDLYNKYIEYIKDANIRVHQINKVSLKMYNDIQHLVKLCSALHKMRLAKRYEYADYPVNIPDYAEFTDMFDHLIQSVRLAFESEIKKDCSNYLKYSKKLVETNSRNLSATMFSDYLCTLFNSRNYAEVYTMFKQNKKYIMHFLHKQNYTMSRLNLISTIIDSGYMTNKNITRTEFTEILSNINPKDYVNSEHINRAYKHITNIIEAIKKRDLTITSMGFDITARSEIGEICLICLENIDDNNTDTIKCRWCKKELGHISCILTWIKTKNTCPNCRASVEKRLSALE